MSKIKYGTDELDFVDTAGNVLGVGDVVKMVGSDDLWDVKDVWMGDDIPMITLESVEGDRINVPTQCVKRM